MALDGRAYLHGLTKLKVTVESTSVMQWSWLSVADGSPLRGSRTNYLEGRPDFVVSRSSAGGLE